MIVRVILVLALLYLFLVAIEVIGSSFKSLGADSAEKLITSFTNPFAALAAGILATVLVTSTIVGLVGQNALPVSVAVPMIMGANIGTTVTNTLVSLGQITRKNEFKRAFAGATVHDFFNLRRGHKPRLPEPRKSRITATGKSPR